MKAYSKKVLLKAFKIYRSRFQIPIQIRNLHANTLSDIDSFCFEAFGNSVLRFIKGLEVSKESYSYYYSNSVTAPTLYSSAYACMTLSLFGKIDNLNETSKADWCQYFNSFQNPKDGLFYDPTIENKSFIDCDWWGARHLALHMISAYSALGKKPEHQFYFLKQYYSDRAIYDWLDSYDWYSAKSSSSVSKFEVDLDNKIMNIGALLQYQRDTWGDTSAAHSLNILKDYLREKLINKTGMWGNFNIKNKLQRSRMIQFAYHLFPVFFYDGEFDFDVEKIVVLTLSTQNQFGGFGILSNSSACEDIDSVDLLIRLYPYVSDNLQIEINSCLKRAFRWIILNQVDDGGFVFRLYEPFRYCSDQMKSDANEGALFPTWFRSLSIFYILSHFNDEFRANIYKCPGLVFP